MTRCADVELNYILASSFQKNWMEHGNLKELRAIDLDSSDNLSEEMLQKFITVYGPQLHGLHRDDINRTLILKHVTLFQDSPCPV